ncbi:MAG: SDR family oxidoreductase [Puniceicoccaceae bacterium]|nr:MAG: SDR family oxidoreductase [Puniceicoccaceae bacterium]
MKVVIAGGHGQIALHLHPLLIQRGHTVAGLIRNPDHAGDLRAAGAEPVLCDLEAEDDLGRFIAGADAVIFAAGAGPGSGAPRKWTVDRDGALKLMRAAQAGSVRRYIMISAMKVEEPRGNEVFRAYLQAKAEADAALRTSGLDWTIVRPGGLRNEPGNGKVAIAASLPDGSIPRTDVAAVVAAVLDTPVTIGRQFDLTSGDSGIDEALSRLI